MHYSPQMLPRLTYSGRTAVRFPGRCVFPPECSSVFSVPTGAVRQYRLRSSASVPWPDRVLASDVWWLRRTIPAPSGWDRGRNDPWPGSDPCPGHAGSRCRTIPIVSSWCGRGLGWWSRWHLLDFWSAKKKEPENGLSSMEFVSAAVFKCFIVKTRSVVLSTCSFNYNTRGMCKDLRQLEIDKERR